MRPAVTGLPSNSVRKSELPLLYWLTRKLSRVRRVGPYVEFGHRRPPRYEACQNVSVGWIGLI